MNWDRIEGQWKQLKGRLREYWGEVTDDAVRRFSGRREQLVGRIQLEYGLARDKAVRQARHLDRRI